MRLSQVQEIILKHTESKEVKVKDTLILSNYLFDKQLAFVQDNSPFKVAVCSRRAGKSTSVAGDLVETAYTHPDCTTLYITGTRSDAKKIIWGEVLKFNREHNLGGTPNISELTLSFPNGSVVRLGGAKDEQEIEKFRGQLPPVRKVFIDEAQSIRDRVLTKLIDDVLEASLLDFAGSICLLGTPGHIPAGYFYRISHNLGEDNQPLPEQVWSAHKWTFFDNPFIPVKSKTTHQKLLERVLKRRGVTISHPSIQREFFGRWEADTESLLITYDERINNFQTLPKDTYTYIMGVDIGFNDADAIAVLACAENSQNVYLIEEVIKKRQDITSLMEMVEDVRKRYDISKIVIDAGALGKKIAEELIRRHQVPLVAAEKVRKMENIALLNDYLRTGRFKAKSNSHFVSDSYLVEIDKDKTTPDKIVVSTRYHSDIIDAVLYAFKESYSYVYQPPKIAPKPGTKEWMKQQEEEMFKQAVEQARAEREAESRTDGLGWEDYD